MTRTRILLLLLLATVVYRASFFLEIFARDYAGIQFTVEDGLLKVSRLEETDPFGRPTAAARAGLRVGDRVLAILDQTGKSMPIEKLNDLGDGLRKVRGTPNWGFTVLRKDPSGTDRQIHMKVARGEAPEAIGDSVLTVILTSILPLIGITTAFFIGFSKPEDDHAFLASLLFLSFSSVITISLYMLPPGLRDFARIYETTCSAFLPYLFMRFFLLFPSPSWIDRKMPWLKQAFLVFTLILLGTNLVSNFTAYYSFRAFEKVQNVTTVLRVPLNIGFFGEIGIGLISLLMNTFRKQSPDEKRRMRILLAGVALGCILPAILIAWLVQMQATSIWILCAIGVSLAAFPAAFAYVVIRHRVLGIRLIVRRGIQYILVSRGFWIIETLILFTLLYLFARPLLIRFMPVLKPGQLTILIAGISIALFFLIRRLNQPVMQAIDKRFFRQSYDARAILTELSNAVGRLAASPAELLQHVTDRIAGSLCPSQVAIFLRGYDIVETDGKLGIVSEKNDQYYCVWVKKGGEDSKPQLSHLSFPPGALVSKQLQEMQEPETLEVYLEDPRSWTHALMQASGELLAERDLLEQLNVRLIVPLTASGKTLGFLSLGEKLSEEAYTKEDKSLLLSVAQQAGIALDYSKLITQVAEQERAKREMEIARQVQAQLFPQTLPTIAHLEYTGYCRAARGVGGDYYDFLSLKQNMLGIALADISGKGISAALLMAGLQALMRSNAPSHEKALDQLFPRVNQLMCSSTARGKYATFFYGIYDCDDMTLDYVNAGHLPPMLFRKDGDVERLRTGGTVVGMLADAVYKQDQVKLKQGDVLLIYSDGVSEAMNASDEELGEDRLQELVRPHLQESSEKIRDVILSGIESFVKGFPQNDDITVVIARVV